MARRASVRTHPPLSPLLVLAIFLLTIAEEDEEELLALLVFFIGLRRPNSTRYGLRGSYKRRHDDFSEDLLKVEVMSAVLGSPWKEYHKGVFGNVHTWCGWVGAGCQMAAGRPLKKLMANSQSVF
ncbi:hypothetical protein M422DRAFT_252948 [Sphaerobolus stellatus SS14]|uniref:Uncharacterized protein n=1 Tax=Sphaerobolus stellatus (strain SS14) TaxID=990650 RepID=A0A0C9V9P8_SPHS4|nr:hypothetical protein M422DRAFT_252948 [Sphaerobolus stellatus SS14]